MVKTIIPQFSLVFRVSIDSDIFGDLMLFYSGQVAEY
jgi:hypothetical protein